MYHRLLPIAAISDRFSQRLYRKISKRLLTKSGVFIEGNPLWISPRTYFDISAPGAITLGDGCVISHGVSLLTHDFSMDRAAVHILGDRIDGLEYVKRDSISIGKNAFIGLGCIILPGITIGDGAIVGAGSVVTKDVLENSIVGGNPARVLGTTADNLNGRLASFSLSRRRK